MGRVLVGACVIRVADVATHRQAKQLSHEVIFKSGADDLSLVGQIFRSDESNNAVDEKRMESARHSVSACFECQLIDSVMRIGGKSAALAGFEVHHVIPYPANIALAMMLENLFAAFAQHVQSDSEA